MTCACGSTDSGNKINDCVCYGQNWQLIAPINWRDTVGRDGKAGGERGRIGMRLGTVYFDGNVVFLRIGKGVESELSQSLSNFHIIFAFLSEG